MTAFVTLDCPYPQCRAKNSTFEMFIERALPFNHTEFRCAAVCKTCHEMIVISCKSRNGSVHVMPSSSMNWRSEKSDFIILDVFPAAPRLHEIENLPENVRSVYEEAELNFADGRIGSAGRAYRTALERAMRKLVLDEGLKLYPRIEKAAADGLLPADLVKVAHNIRLIGNDASHEDDDPTFEEVSDAREFTRLLLLFCFELKARIDKVAASVGETTPKV